MHVSFQIISIRYSVIETRRETELSADGGLSLSASFVLYALKLFAFRYDEGRFGCLTG